MAFLKPPIRLAQSDNEASLKFISELDLMNSDLEFTDELFKHADRLWRDAGVQECFSRANEYPLIDCAK